MTTQPRWAGTRRNAIIDQQLWFLGRDIGGPHGNALLAYGFERHRPLRHQGSSAYLLNLADPSPDGPRVLICWGFGVYVGADATVAARHRSPVRAATDAATDAATHAATHAATDAATHAPAPWSGLLFQRFGASPGLVRSAVSPGLHQVADLPARWPARTDTDDACAARFLHTLAHTLADYERWAISTLGSAHRAAALSAAPRHKRHRFLHTSELSVAWERWAEQRCARIEPGVTHGPQRAVA